MHYLREFDQANCRGELRIFHRRCYSPRCLRMCKICWDFENFRREMIDPAQETAPAGDEDACPQITEVWFLFESALEQFKGFLQPQVNDRVQGFALDLFSSKAGVILEQNHVAGKAVSKDATAFF